MKRWFDEGFIRRRDKPLKAKDRLVEGDEIIIIVPQPRELNLEPRPLNLKFFYEDESLAVLYKPRGITMHPGAGTRDETTLVHALIAHSSKLSSKSGVVRPGIVHRLDKQTEGIIVIAKNDSIHDHLSSQFSSRTIDRNYWALVFGKPPTSMSINKPIGRHPVDRKKMAVVKNGKPSVTHVRRLAYFQEGYSWIDCKLETGRTHQIRVHLASEKFPLLNDNVYSKAKRLELPLLKQQTLESLDGQALVAYRLGFDHPITGKRICFEIDKPKWLSVMTDDL